METFFLLHAFHPFHILFFPNADIISQPAQKAGSFFGISTLNLWPHHAQESISKYLLWPLFQFETIGHRKYCSCRSYVTENMARRHITD